MKFKRRLRIEKGHLDVTPIINVFFLLLIFFMFTSSFIFQPGIKVDLPRAVTSEVVQQENIVVIITRDGRVYIDDREVTRDELSSRISLASKEKASLLIKADAGVSHGKVVDVWDTCRAYGLSHVSIATSR